MEGGSFTREASNAVTAQGRFPGFRVIAASSTFPGLAAQWRRQTRPEERLSGYSGGTAQE